MIGGTTSRISGAGTEQAKIGSWSSGADYLCGGKTLNYHSGPKVKMILDKKMFERKQRRIQMSEKRRRKGGNQLSGFPSAEWPESSLLLQDMGTGVERQLGGE